MPLGDKQRRFLECFYPSLIDAVGALGQGEFQEASPELKGGAAGLRTVGLGLTYRFGKYLLDIWIRLQWKGASPTWAPPAPVLLTDWAPAYYRLHYGCPTAEPDTIFRFDRDVPSGPHVHIRPDPKVHVPASSATPDTTNMDPREFVALVAEFRRTNQYPIKRK